MGEAGQDRRPSPVVLLVAKPLKRLFQERLGPQVGTDGRREDAAVPERGPREQLAALEAAGGVGRLGEPLVPGGVLPGPVVRVRQVQEQLAPERLVLAGRSDRAARALS